MADLGADLGAEWLHEAGLGEDRAILVDDAGDIIRAEIDVHTPSLKGGAVIKARLRERRIAEYATREQIYIEGAPPRFPLGAELMVRVTRSALAEFGKPKRAKGIVVSPDTPTADAPSLLDRLNVMPHPIRKVSVHEPDALEQAGWSELLDQAQSGIMPHQDAVLRVNLTPAMTLIDVDGDRDASELLILSAQAIPLLVARFGLAGSIGVDFPTVGDKTARAKAQELVNAGLSKPFEATAINGFGFMQIIIPRTRASIMELAQHDRAGFAARALIRQAQRSGLIGKTMITAHPSVIAEIEANEDWTAALAAHLGGAATLQADAGLAIGAGHVSKV